MGYRKYGINSSQRIVIRYCQLLFVYCKYDKSKQFKSQWYFPMLSQW
jgi:hypothetical protein